MADFSYSKRGVSLNQYSDEHMSVSMHAQGDRHADSSVTVTATHHPQSAEDAERQCHEFYSIEIAHRVQTAKDSGDFSLKVRTSDSISAFLDRDAIEALHFATGELLAQSEGLGRGAASGRVVAEAGAEHKTEADE